MFSSLVSRGIIAMFSRSKPVVNNGHNDDKYDDELELIDILKTRISELTEEKQEIKADLKAAHAFIQQLCMQLVENSKAVNMAAASKPSAVETYLANKNAMATASPKDLNKSANGSPKLPG